MKVGFVSAILDGWTLEEVLEVAQRGGYQCVELACWPQGAAERRYAGVSHLDVAGLDDARAGEVLALCAERGVGISALGYYPNVLSPDAEAAGRAIEHLHRVIDASARLGVNLVTTFIGRDQHACLEDNLARLGDVWKPIMAHAAASGVRVAIENCPMLFGPDQWPGGQNLFTSPLVWGRVFEAVGSEALGLNFDPSHFVWQMMDYLAPVEEFADRLWHVHFKDIRLDRRRLDRVGTMAYPLDFMEPVLPGHGDVDWGAFVAALDSIGYDGPACVEVEDRAYEGSRQRILDSLTLSKRYLDQFVV